MITDRLVLLCGRTESAIQVDGGYAEYMIAAAEAVAAIPDTLSAPEAAPQLCAGLTVFSALRNAGAQAGDTVAAGDRRTRPPRHSIGSANGIPHHRYWPQRG